jgi:hypothetical protein
VSLLAQVEVATRELTEDALPHVKDVPRLLAGLIAEVENPGALEARANKLVDAGIVAADEFAKHFVKTQVEVAPVGESAVAEPETPAEKPTVTVGW